MARFNVTDSDGNQNLIEAEEDYVKANYASYEEVTDIPHEVVPENDISGRVWRDQELKDTDWIISITDHPQHAAYKTYRQKLRDWPADSDNFPGTKPTLGE